MRIVYSSLNVESELKAVTLKPRRDAVQRIARVVELEDRLLQRADLVVCVSEEDRERFRGTHPGRRYEVIVSGARVDAQDELPAEGASTGEDLLGVRSLAVFMGSGHTP